MDANSPASRTVFMMGIAVAVIAEDPCLLDAAGAALAAWCGERTDEAGSAATIRLELAHATCPCEDVSFAITVEGSRLLVGPRGFWGLADDAAGTARARVPAGLVAIGPALLSELLEPLLLFLLVRRDRTPLHAAAFLLGDAAILLSGPSGTGKSTLALAAARRGLAVLSDDTVYIQRRPALRIWSLPGAIHVLAAEAPPGPHRLRRRNGKDKAALPAAMARGAADRAVPVVLVRGDRIALEPMAAAAARTALLRLEPGFDLLAPQSEEAVDTLLARSGAWQLTLAHDPDDAIERLVAQFATKRGCA